MSRKRNNFLTVERVEVLKEVKEAREALRSSLISAYFFIETSKIKDMTSGELLRLVIDLYESPYDFDYFKKNFYDRYAKNKQGAEEYQDQLANAYATFLYNKLASTRFKKEFIEKHFLSEVFEEMYDGTATRDKKTEQVILLLQEMNERRIKSSGKPRMGFHVSNRKIQDGEINEPSKLPQTNINSQNPFISTGAKFLNFDLKKLFNSGGTERYLYLIESSEDTLKHVYDEATQAAATQGNLLIYSPYPEEPIEGVLLTPETIKDLNVSFGAV